MAHSADAESWGSFLQDAGIPSDAAATYAEALAEECITDHLDLTKEILKEIGVNKIGHQLSILKFCKKAEQPTQTGEPRLLLEGPHPERPLPGKPPTVSAPHIKSEMTNPEFRKLKIDWGVFKSLTRIPTSQLAAQIYTSCDSNVQTSIINSSTSDFFSLSEAEIFKLLEKIVTKRSNPSVHRLAFSNVVQSEGEAVKDFVVRLNSHARDCEFACPHCKGDLMPINVKDQLLRGLHNSTLQTDVLAKSETLKNLEDIVKHAESFEAARDDQSKLHGASDVMGARATGYKRQQQSRLKGRWNDQHQPPPAQPESGDTTQQKGWQGSPSSRKRTCPGCGSTSGHHRREECPAWGRKCHNCDLPNHFAKVCRQPRRNPAGNPPQHESASAIIAHVTYDQSEDVFTSASPVSEIRFVPAEMTPIIGGKRRPKRTIQVFPDSGADICLAGSKHLAELNIPLGDLTPCRKVVRAVGGSLLTCIGWFQCEFEMGGNVTCQPIYICEKVDRIYFSREACMDVTILPQTFPLPMKKSGRVSSIEPPTLPPRPDKVPLSPTEENIPKLKAYLTEKFADSVFNRTTPFRMMNCAPAHIHLKKDAKPVAIHNPFSIPVHWREEVKRRLDRDVADGIIEPVPIGEPVIWCSPMVVAAKADGSPRRTVDLQKLNQQCLRETHHCQSPFRLASQVPCRTKKSVLDATDGFHAIDLDEESRPLTTFITEWGRYRYRRLPQGYSASQDAYTRRYDDIIKDVPDKVKCIDDTLLYSQDIESAFFAVFDYLTLCARNGITINESKFKFCQDTVTFAGLKITPDGIHPSDELIAAIKNFPTPKDIHDVRSWFGAVNQMAWAYATSPIMQPFRDLVKPSMTFAWDDTLEKLFHATNQLLTEKCAAGIRAFELDRRTCLQTDWSKAGVGYLLLQQHCDCDTAKAPVCCKDGWKLVFAGSRFTSDAESRYSPTEGEALAIAWSLQHARMFVLGCKDLIVSTDHRPLLGILKDRDLNSISNPRLFNLKEKTLPYTFNVQYNPGKWHRGPDAFSRNPVAALIAEPANDQSSQSYPTEEIMAARSQASIAAISSSDCDPLLTIADIHAAAAKDATHQLLHHTIANGFPASRNDLKEELRAYWTVRDRLSLMDGLVMMGDRVVIPATHRKPVLNALHAAHQGASSMIARAQIAVYWPGVDADIHNKRFTCRTCNETAPSNPKEPLRLSPAPAYPYQQICLDFFHMGHHTYLACVDRFSGWLTIFHFGKSATSAELISACRSVFVQNGVAEEVCTDGGPQLASSEFAHFLESWGVHHRLSSVDYPQSNGRAELAVKSAKRIIRDNTRANGSIDNDCAARAILQHRNTPLKDLGMSPAQLLLHRELRDHIPVNPSHYQLHKDWILAAAEREKLYARRNDSLEAAYNRDAHTLQPLTVQTAVMIQTKGKWDKSGHIIDVLPHRQYRVKVDGSGRVTLRNRRFMRTIAGQPRRIATPSSSGCPIPQPNNAVSPHSASPLPPAEVPQADSGVPPETHATAEPATDTPSDDHLLPQATGGTSAPARVPKALRDLLDYNEPGLTSQEPGLPGRTRSGRPL
jgi:hypothetical protein